MRGKCRNLLSTVAVLTTTAAAQPVAATINATRTGQPITKLVFGGFMEPATTRVWAEMLYDRKFLNEINSRPQPAAPAQGFGRRGLWRLTAPAGTPPPPPGPGGFGFGPPATMAESTLPAMPRTIALPPASISVYEFEIRQ